MDETNIAISEIALAAATMNALLVLALDRRGVLSKAEYADTLKRQIKALEGNPHAHAGPDRVRVDLRAMQAVIGFIEGPPPKGWTPVVIDGGKS